MTLKNDVLKWGIIGAGIIAHKMADAINRCYGNYLLGVASKTPSKAKAFAKKHKLAYSYSYDEMVTSNEIDIIYIATTHNFHYENTKLALEHGKHVLVEKPFTVNANEAKELVQLARDKNLFLMEAMWTRFLPGIIRLKEIIKNGGIGSVKQINISFGGFVKPKYANRLQNPALAGGVTLDMGIYPISIACYLLDELPREIKSIASFSDSGVDETANYLFRFPSNCLADLSASYNLKMKNESTIYGTKAYVSLPNFPFSDQFTIHRHNGSNDISEIDQIDKQSKENGFIYQVEEVRSCILQKKLESEIMPLDETIGIMKIMDKMRADWGLVYPFENPEVLSS